MIRHIGTPSGNRTRKYQDDVNPDETGEPREEEKEYKVKLTVGGVLLGLIKLLIVCILVTVTIVFLTSLVVIGPRVGLSGFFDFTVGLLTGYYSLLSPADVLALRGDLELIMLFEFLFLLLLGLYMIAALRLSGEGSPRAYLGMRGRPGYPPIGKSQGTGQQDRKRKARRGLGIEVILLLVAVFIAIALLFGLV